MENGVSVPAKAPIISAHCVRVAVADGHLATCWASFEKPATKEEIIEPVDGYNLVLTVDSVYQSSLEKACKEALEVNNAATAQGILMNCKTGAILGMASLPNYDLNNRGMGISLGRLRGDSLFDWRFVGLSHNTLRGAAGGAVLIAELLCTQGYIPKK